MNRCKIGDSLGIPILRFMRNFDKQPILNFLASATFFYFAQYYIFSIFEIIFSFGKLFATLYGHRE